MAVAPIGKTLIGLGIVFVVLGVVLILGEKSSWAGRLPGDFLIRRDNFTIYFPLTSSLLLSLLVAIVVWLFRYFRT